MLINKKQLEKNEKEGFQRVFKIILNLPILKIVTLTVETVYIRHIMLLFYFYVDPLRI